MGIDLFVREIVRQFYWETTGREAGRTIRVPVKGGGKCFSGWNYETGGGYTDG